MPKPFKIEPHTTIDKRFRIMGPEIDLLVDYDDVDHKEVDRAARKLVKILNEHWEAFNPQVRETAIGTITFTRK